jgi:hypothetical protein
VMKSSLVVALLVDRMDHEMDRPDRPLHGSPIARGGGTSPWPMSAIFTGRLRAASRGGPAPAPASGCGAGGSP